MNADEPVLAAAHEPAPSDPSWSRRRWWTVCLILFSGHIGIIAYLGRTPPWPAPVPPPSTHTIFASILGPVLPRNDEFVANPIPVALSSRDLQAGRGRTLPYPMDDASPLVRWLGIGTNGSGLGSLPPSTHQPPPRPAEVLPDLPDTRPVRIGTAIRTSTAIQGNLKGRQLLTPPPNVEWTGAEPIRATTIEILVNGSGRPLSPRVIESSGNKAADQLASETAMKLRFQPLPGIRAASANHPSNLVSGRILFRWGFGPPDSPPPATR